MVRACWEHSKTTMSYKWPIGVSKKHHSINIQQLIAVILRATNCFSSNPQKKKNKLLASVLMSTFSVHDMCFSGHLQSNLIICNRMKLSSYQSIIPPLLNNSLGAVKVAWDHDSNFEIRPCFWTTSNHDYRLQWWLKRKKRLNKIPTSYGRCRIGTYIETFPGHQWSH